MSNYSPVANYSIKDALPSGTPAKLVSATELGIEFTAIATMSASKEDAINKGAASGYAGLDSTSRLLNATLPLQAANSFKGNNTGSPATPIDLTATQATAMLNVFSTALQGLVPASGSATTTHFLRDDGTWAVPPGTATGATLVVKPTTVTRVSNATLTTDADFTTALAAGTYLVEVILKFQAASTGAANGHKWLPIMLTGTADAPNFDAVMHGGSGGATAVEGIFGTTAVANTNQTVQTPGSSTDFTKFILTVSAPGNLGLQWCQNTSGAQTLGLLAGSMFRITKIL